MRTFCVLSTLWLLAAGMASAVMTTITVLGPDQQPVAGATVYLMHSKTVNGKYTELLTDAAGGIQYELQLGDDPKKPQAFAFVYRPGMALGYARITTASVTVQLSPVTTIFGKVVDTAGAPVAGAMMQLQNVVALADGQMSLAYVIPQLANAFTVLTGADGSWRIGDVPEGGKAFVLFADPRYMRDNCIIPTSPPQTTPVLTIAQPGARIAGRVVNAAGEPVAEVRITADSERPLSNGTTQAISDADGRFLLMGLPSASYVLSTPDYLNTKWLAEPIDGITARTGEETTIADIVVQQAAVIAGRVLDKETQAPVVGIYVARLFPLPRRGYTSEISQNDGTFKFLVTAGSYQVKIGYERNNHKDGYLNQTDAEAITVEVQAGETKMVTLYADKGKSLTGTAVDEQGKPAANLTVRARTLCGECGQEGCAKDREANAMTNALGQFSFSGLPDKPLLLLLPRNQFDCWQWTLDKPLYVAKPGAEPVTFTVRQAEMKTVAGRVLDTDGQPVVGAKVRAQVNMPYEDGGGYSRMVDDIVTDADGRYTIACRPKDTLRLNSIEKPGYKQMQLGKFTAQDGAGTLEDSIMAILDGTVSGVVVGADGKPLAEVTVVSLEGGADARVKTGADGAFALTNIPRGDANVLALTPTLSGGWSGKAGATGVTLTAKPPTEITVDTVLDAWVQADCPNRVTVAMLFLNDGFEKALQVLASDGAPVKDTDRAQLLQAYVRSNPSEALKVAVAQLDQLSTPRELFYTAIAVGMAAGKDDPVLGEHCYAIAKMHVSPTQHPVMQCDRYSPLMELAHLLGHDDDVNTIMEHLLPIARENKSFLRVVHYAAAISPALAQRLWEGLPDDKRLPAMRQAIPIIAKYDAAAAERLNAELPPQQWDAQQYADEQALYAPAVLRALAQTDPAAALAQAKSVRQGSYLRMPALLAVLRYQPRDVALREIRALFDPHDGYDSSQATVSAKMLRYTYDLDPETGRALHAIYVEKYLRSDPRYTVRHIPAYAYCAAPIDPVEARIRLEIGYMNLQGLSDSVNSITHAYYPLAMMAFNQRRALTLADQSGKYRGQAYVELLRYLRSSEEERLWDLFAQNY